MADPIAVTDVFKFVAVRPAQRANEKETQHTIIRDERATTLDGKRQLAQLARVLSRPEEAITRWGELDLAGINPLAESYPELVRIYETPVTGEAPDGQKVLIELGLMDLQEDRARELLKPAWNALYTAYMTGPDAGPRLETPMAALRILHYANERAAGGFSTPAAALEALTATPVVAAPFIEAITAPTESADRPSPTAPAVQSEPSSDRAHMLQLVEDLGTTHQLLETVRAAPSLARPEIHETGATQAGGDRLRSRNEVTLTTAPRFLQNMSGELPSQDNKILTKLRITENTSVPAAARLLKDHMSALTAQAYTLGGNAEFLNIVKDFNGYTGLEKILGPIIDVIDYLPVDPTTSPDVDVTGRIRPLGIGDLKVVKEKLLAYEPGEVAHIENVLKGEKKERNHRVLDRSETILVTSEEENKETERDTQTTDRFEVKKEAEQTIKEDMSVQAGVTATGGYGPVTITAHGDFAYSTSKQESSKSSATFARDVVERSVSKVQTRIKTERTTKTLHEVEEINTHGLNNTDSGTDHITGIYRWVDKKYRAQVYNYGQRLMLEFVVPEPAAYFRASQIKSVAEIVGATPPEPFLDLSKKPLTVEAITETNYGIFAGRYNAAGVKPPPPEYLYVGTAFEQNNIDNGKTISKSVKDIAIPEGYTMYFYNAAVSLIWENHPQFSLQIGGEYYHYPQNTTARQAQAFLVGTGAPSIEDFDDPRGVVPVSVVGYDINAYAVNVQAVSWRTPEHLQKWRLETFDQIYTAYKALKTEYDQKVTQAQATVGIAIEGRNPAMNREIEKQELKKLSITMLTGQHFNSFNAMTDPEDKPKHLPEIDVYESMNEAPIIQFFEQAFEWEQITYLFYPYFWSRKNNWVQTSNLSDPDPLFAHFKQAGAARVVVPVPLAYTKAVLYYLEAKGKDIRKKIWQGGEPPRLDDPLFVSIQEELKDQTDDLAGATPEGKPWEYTLPTTLVWLQGDSQLPVFP